MRFLVSISFVYGLRSDMLKRGQGCHLAELLFDFVERLAVSSLFSVHGENITIY